MTNKFFGTKLLATALATFALASCQSESSLMEPSSDNRRDVELTITATKGDLQTRTDLNLDTKELKLIKTWDLKDKVHVCEADGNYVGFLEVTGLNEDKTQATFKGNVRLLDKDGKHTLSFSTVGTAKDADYSPKKGVGMPDLSYNFANQISTDVHALNANDLMIADCDVDVVGKEAKFTNLILRRQFAYGRFKLLYNDEALTFGENTVVTVDTKNQDIKSKATITFPKTITADRESSLSVTTSKNDFYVAFIPGSDQSEIVFKVTVDGVDYIGYSNSYLIEKNDFFRYREGGPLPINVKRADGKYEQKKYVLVYNSNFGENPETTSVEVESTEKNHEFTVGDYPTSLPTRPNYKFIGWKDDSGADYAVNSKFTINTNPDENGVSKDVLYAQWDHLWTVIWKDGDTTIKTEYVESLDNLENPTLDSKPGYEFVEWSTTKDEENKIVVITAQWRPYTIGTPGYDHGTFN